MAYVGNLTGPKQSEIVSRLGPDYFGISPEELQQNIEYYLEEERNRWVVPVRRASDGRYYIEFSSPTNKTQRFYLDEHGYSIEGKPRIWRDDEVCVTVEPPDQVGS